MDHIPTDYDDNILSLTMDDLHLDTALLAVGAEPDPRQPQAPDTVESKSATDEKWEDMPRSPDQNWGSIREIGHSFDEDNFEVFPDDDDTVKAGVDEGEVGLSCTGFQGFQDATSTRFDQLQKMQDLEQEHVGRKSC